jgi:hypothetical protein
MAMRSAILGCLILLLTLAGGVIAGEYKEIELNDGSTVYGEIVSFSDGVYRVRTSSLGIVEIDDNQIRTIRSNSRGPTAPKYGNQTGNNLNADKQALQQRMISDEEIMTLILSLQDDPDIKAVLNDPELMQAVNSGDIATLTSNPKFMKLLENPKIMQIQQKTLTSP